MDRFDMVKNFHEAFGHPVAESPQMLSKGETAAELKINELFSEEVLSISDRMKEFKWHSGRMLKRMSWVIEELGETMAAETLEDQTDGILDALYLLYGTLVEMGVHPLPLFKIVHEANMSKLWEDGTYRKDPQGKTIKPPSWVAPEPRIRRELKRQILQAQNKSSR
jgi:predicted HAD superfamily Cof-like phosphohydrolase